MIETPRAKLLDSRLVQMDEHGSGYLIDAYECAVAPEHVVDFKVYQAVLCNPGGWLPLDDRCNPVDGRDNAEVYIDGDVKWDGCSNWSFHPADNCMVHLCGPEDVDELAWLIKQCYRFALELKNFTEYEMPESLK